MGRTPRWWLTVFASMAVGAVVSWSIRTETSREALESSPRRSDPPLTLATPEAGGEISIPTLRQRLGDPRLTLRELRHFGEQASSADPESALRAAEDVPGLHTREAYLSAVLTAWGERDGEAAAGWVAENLQGSQRSDALYFVADGWAESDPAAAGSWFEENTSGTVRVDAVWEVAEAWGRRDPAAAATWLKSLESDLRLQVIDGLADGWAAVDPAGAAAFSSQLDEGDLRGGFLSAVARQWASYDPPGAAAWAAGLLREEQVE